MKFFKNYKSTFSFIVALLSFIFLIIFIDVAPYNYLHTLDGIKKDTYDLVIHLWGDKVSFWTVIGVLLIPYGFILNFIYENEKKENLENIKLHNMLEAVINETYINGQISFLNGAEVKFKYTAFEFLYRNFHKYQISSHNEWVKFVKLYTLFDYHDNLVAKSSTVLLMEKITEIQFEYLKLFGTVNIDSAYSKFCMTKESTETIKEKDGKYNEIRQEIGEWEIYDRERIKEKVINIISI